MVKLTTTKYAIFHACVSTELTRNGNDSFFFCCKKSNFKIKVPRCLVLSLVLMSGLTQKDLRGQL